MPRVLDQVNDDVRNKPCENRLVRLVCQPSYRLVAMGITNRRFVFTPNLITYGRPFAPAPGINPALASKYVNSWRIERVPTYPVWSTKPAPRSRCTVKLKDSM